MQGILSALQAAMRMLQAQDEVNNPTDSGLAMTVRVNTASQKAIQKLERKAARRKQGREQGKGAGLDELDYARTVGWAALQARTPHPLTPTQVISLFELPLDQPFGWT